MIEQCLVDVYPYLYLLVGVRQGGRVDLHAPGQAASYYPTLPIWTVIHLRLASASASAAIGSSQDHIYSIRADIELSVGPVWRAVLRQSEPAAADGGQDWVRAATTMADVRVDDALFGPFGRLASSWI